MADKSLNEIQLQINEMLEAIALANKTMDKPVSDLHGKFVVLMKENIFRPIAQNSSIKAKLATELQRCLSTGRIEQTVTGFLVIGTGLAAVTVASAGIDATRNALAKQKARDMLLGCYKELAVKQNELILKQMNINRELEAKINSSQAELDALRSKRREIDESLYKISMLLAKYNSGGPK